MPVSKKSEQKKQDVKASQPSQAAVAYYRRSSKDIAQYPTKRVLNLCMKEKSNMPPEAFLGILAAIIVVVLLLEFFGVYRPYRSLELAQADLNAAQSHLQQTYDSMSDYDDIHDEYYQYNFNEFDRTLADRLDVLDLLKRELFDKAKINTLNVSANTINLNMTGVKLKEQLPDIQESLLADPFVATVFSSSQSSQNDTATLVITLKSADVYSGICNKEYYKSNFEKYKPVLAEAPEVLYLLKYNVFGKAVINELELNENVLSFNITADSQLSAIINSLRSDKRVKELQSTDAADKTTDIVITLAEMSEEEA